ncbi:hypothetical protein EDC56_3690 [Sinobacterium caligoides]|uniref:Uncharacterized protein n=1 Tax=Sinobacterium caligoides TaxID=933926 RepID=A0A3N2DED8_9GAMM|nr:hypothetical protein [Sinobacterium caligoides]ROR98018.1 hypothetical protein EDC56_3690 [Sinobacterium caligoides]
MSTHSNNSIDLKLHTAVLTTLLVITLISNWLTPLTTVSLTEAVPGFLIIFAICLMGLIVAKYAPFYLPSVAWISLLSILLTLPWTPGSAWLSNEMGKVNFLAMLPPVLGYAGLAISDGEMTTFKQSGLKIAIVAMLVFTGTYLGSAVVAQFALSF